MTDAIVADAIVAAYQKAVAKIFMEGCTDANVARVEAIEAAHPWVVDEVYRRTQSKKSFLTL